MAGILSSSGSLKAPLPLAMKASVSSTTGVMCSSAIFEAS